MSECTQITSNTNWKRFCGRPLAMLLLAVHLADCIGQGGNDNYGNNTNSTNANANTRGEHMRMEDNGHE